MARDLLIPKDRPPDMRAIHRFAVAQAAAARRQRRARAARDWGRVVRKALRALRFAARIEAGRVHDDPPSSHPLFSDAPEKFGRRSLRPPRPILTAVGPSARGEGDDEAAFEPS